MEKEKLSHRNEPCFIVRSETRDRFVTIDTTCLRDESLSWKAKGVFSYLMTNKSDWRIRLYEIQNHARDGKDSLYSAIKELEHHKYIYKKKYRTNNGKFAGTIYYVYEKPYEANAHMPCMDIPYLGNPETVTPETENTSLTNINLTNNKLIRTKLTNTNLENESFFRKVIIELFGSYPFDDSFEEEVMKVFNISIKDESLITDYLKYVYERTNISQPKKSFASYYRKLAKSSSIISDFNMTINNKTNKISASSVKMVNCPICKTSFEYYSGECPVCHLSVRAINQKDEVEIQIKTSLHAMSELELAKIEQAWDYFATEYKERTGQIIVPESVRTKFYIDYLQKSN